MVVPVCLRREILTQYHDSIMGGGHHQGPERTYHCIKAKYHWDGMYADVHTHVKACDTCQRVKNTPHLKRAPLQPMPCADVFERWHMDFLGPLHETNKGNRYIYFSWWTVLVAGVSVSLYHHQKHRERQKSSTVRSSPGMGLHATWCLTGGHNSCPA